MSRTNYMKKLLAIVLAVSLSVGAVNYVGLHNTNADVRELPHNPIYNEDTDTTEWDYVYFGNYPQSRLTDEEITDEIVNADYDDNDDVVVDGVEYRRVMYTSVTYSSRDTERGFYNWKAIGRNYIYFRYEPIKWRVLQNEGDSLLLLADSVLDCQQYERSDGKITWSTCNLRLWLNGYSPFNIYEGYNFLTAAFDENERNAIVSSQLANPNNPFHGTSGGANTSDKVFLLSVPEVTNEEYGFAADYMKYSKTRHLGATEYARAMGVWMGSYNELYNDNAIWLLRTPGSYQQSVSMVYWFGNVYQDGYYANEKYYGVAPAIRVSTDSDLWRIADDNSESESVTLYNASSSNNFSLKDAKAALKIALGIEQGSKEQIFAYDLSGDGKVDLNEVKKILKVALGIETLTQQPVSTDAPNKTDAPDATDTPGTTQEPVVTDTPDSPQITPVIPQPVQTVSPSPVPTQEPLSQKEYEASGKIWIAGDSIAAYHSKNGYSQPLYGWGELIGNYFENSKTLLFSTNDSKENDKLLESVADGSYSVCVNDTAISSRSSQSFIKEPNYTTIKNNMSKGDYLIISFGHNDERASVDLYTDPFGRTSDKYSFKWYLKNYYIDPAIRAGVWPVLLTPVPRRYFYNGEFVNPQLHTPYAQAMKELVEEYEEMGIKLYCIDLHSYMLDKYEELGENGTAYLHGKYGNTMDNTHLSEDGATIVCEYIIDEMISQNMNISKFIKK